MPVELKPCPFCGGESGLGVVRGVGFYALCAECITQGPYCWTEEEAANAWNARSVDAENARLREELEQERRNYFDCREENTALHMLLEEKAQELVAAEAKLTRLVEFLTKWSRWVRDSDKLAMTGRDARGLLESIRAPDVVAHGLAPAETQTAKCESCEAQAKLARAETRLKYAMEDARKYNPDRSYCPAREDHQHCDCWWEGDACCACGAPGMTDDEKRECGMLDDSTAPAAIEGGEDKN